MELPKKPNPIDEYKKTLEQRITDFSNACYAKGDAPVVFSDNHKKSVIAFLLSEYMLTRTTVLAEYKETERAIVEEIQKDYGKEIVDEIMEIPYLSQDIKVIQELTTYKFNKNLA